MKNLYSQYFFKVCCIFLFIILYTLSLLIKSLYSYRKINTLNNEKLSLSYELIDIYSILFDYFRNGHIKPKYNITKEKYYYDNEKHNGICICSIGKKTEFIYKRICGISYFIRYKEDNYL